MKKLKQHQVASAPLTPLVASELHLSDNNILKCPGLQNLNNKWSIPNFNQVSCDPISVVPDSEKERWKPNT